MKNFYASEWLKLLSYVVTSCPNLKNLDVRVGLHESSPSASKVVCDRLFTAMRAMMDLFNAYVDDYELDEIQSSGHELFRMGVDKPA
uniref:Uncharacterized protein n=1 Tax=Ditylenchus dipsaci TaxID=166011 RepID=A0A915EH53_9BILA